jgi:hypothetical protein
MNIITLNMSCCVIQSIVTISDNPCDSVMNINNIYTPQYEETREGFGIVCDFLGKMYVISCLHIIGKNNKSIIGLFSTDDKKIFNVHLKIFRIIEELDMVLLEINDDEYVQDILYYTKNELMTDISKVVKSVEDIKLLFLEENRGKFNINKIDTHTFHIKDDYVKSTMIPEIPLIKFTINLDDIQDDTYSDSVEGLSGTILSTNKSVVGIVITYNFTENVLEAIPMSIIYDLFLKIINYKSQPLTSFYFHTELADIEDDNNKNITIHSITNSKEIKYSDNSGNIKKYIKFKKNDIIMSIDDINFNRNGTLFCEKYGLELNLRAYVMLVGYTNTIKISLYRIIKDKHKEMILNIDGIQFNDMYKVNMFNNDEYVYWRGMCFVELSLEMLSNVDNNINLVGDIFNNTMIMTNNKTKIVMLISIDKKSKSYQCDDVFYNNIPFVKYKNDGHTFLIIHKINGELVNNLKDLKIKLDDKKNSLHESKCIFKMGHKFLSVDIPV